MIKEEQLLPWHIKIKKGNVWKETFAWLFWFQKKKQTFSTSTNNVKKKVYIEEPTKYYGSRTIPIKYLTEKKITKLHWENFFPSDTFLSFRKMLFDAKTAIPTNQPLCVPQITVKEQWLNRLLSFDKFFTIYSGFPTLPASCFLVCLYRIIKLFPPFSLLHVQRVSLSFVLREL